MTDASPGTRCISRADAAAPPGHPGGSELPEPSCLVMKVAARALTSDADTDGGKWALPLQMSRKGLVKQKGGVGPAAPERDCQRSCKYSSARPGPAPSLFQGNLTNGTPHSQMENVIKKNRGGSGGSAVGWYPSHTRSLFWSSGPPLRSDLDSGVPGHTPW